MAYCGRRDVVSRLRHDLHVLYTDAGERLHHLVQRGVSGGPIGRQRKPQHTAVWRTAGRVGALASQELIVRGEQLDEQVKLFELDQEVEQPRHAGTHLLRNHAEREFLEGLAQERLFRQEKALQTGRPPGQCLFRCGGRCRRVGTKRDRVWSPDGVVSERAVG
jgi:hypothetical protein